MKTTKQDCEYIRSQGKRIFDKVRGTWLDSLRWTQPHRATWMESQTQQGERKNHHIVDPTHLIAIRSAVAGFLEGNTSTTRPWFRIGTRDAERNDNHVNKAWLQHFTNRVLSYIGSSNFYTAASTFYNDYHTVNTGAHYFDELPEGGVHVHTLVPGSYYVINDAFGVAAIMVREFTLNVKSIVDKYGTKDANGKADWSNISHTVRKMYEDRNYSQLIDIVHTIKENPEFNPENPSDPNNRKWLELVYELGGSKGHYFAEGQEFGHEVSGVKDVFLKRYTSARKLFVVGKSTDTFEYGEKGPTLDALGLIKSLNKKAIGKDQALEQMLNPALQGPASLRRSYVSSSPNSFVPIDSRSGANGQKLEPIFQVSPAIGALIQDVGDMRQQVDKIYYADFLLYLSSNPKTRTAAETNAIVDEQNRIIGPALQSLNFTYNVPIVEYFMEYVLDEDPYLEEAPEGLRGQALNPDFISVFAQAQRAADLPSIDRYAAMIGQVAQMDPKILQKIDTDKLADLYEDRLYLPSGLNRPQDEVDKEREKAAKAMERERMINETMPQMAKTAKDAASAQAQGQG